MNSSYSNAFAEQLRKREQNFITSRVTNEQVLQRWIDGCQQLPDEVFTALGIDKSTLNARILLSKSYEENLSSADVNAQIDSVNALIERVNQYVISLNEKALSLCSQMDSMGGVANGNNGI